MRALPSRVPLQVAYSRLPEAERAAEELAARHRIEVVHVEHMRGAAMASRVASHPRVFDAVDSITRLFEASIEGAPSRGQRLAARLDLARTRAFERRATHLFDRVVVTSDAEVESFRRLGADPPRLSAIPNGVDTSYFAAGWVPQSPPRVVFTGKMSYHANEAAALRLVERIMPRVWRELPDARVVLAGKDPSPRLHRLTRDRRVAVTGFVDDLRPWIRQSSVAVSPLVYGAGIQNKVLEAMSSGVPTVASPGAVGALAVQAGRDLLVATSDDTFAAEIVRVIRDRELAGQLGRNARHYVEGHHDWIVQARMLADVYASAVAGRRARGQG